VLENTPGKIVALITGEDIDRFQPTT